MITNTRFGIAVVNTTVGLAAALLLSFGCDGEVGRQGAVGPAGPQGGDGPAGQPGELDPNLSTWDKALAGIGGEAALESLTGFEIQGSGMRNLAGEGYRAGDPATTVDAFDIAVSYDIAGDAVRVDWQRNILFAGGVPLDYSEIVNGQLGYVDGDDSFFGTAASTTDMPSARWAAVRKQTMLLNPQVILEAVLKGAMSASEGGVALHNGAIHELLVVDNDIYPITLWINASTGRVAKLTTMENDHLLRDVELEVHYHDWMNDPNGVAFPLSVFLVLDGNIVHEEYRSSVTINPTFADDLFDFPPGAAPVYNEAEAMWGAASHQFHQGFASLGLPFDFLQSYVQAEMLSPGVYFLSGGSHNSMVVEQAGGVVVIEPPLYQERSEAILDWIATQFPGKEVTHVVISHHHHDHAAGARTFVAAGATVVLAEPSAAFFAHVFQAESTIWPDELAMNPAPANIVTVPVGGSHTIVDGGGNNDVEVYYLPTGHAGDMVMSYVDSGQFVFESDLWNPDPTGGSTLFPPFAAEFLDAIIDSGIYDPALTIVGGHGIHGPVTDLSDYVSGL